MYCCKNCFCWTPSLIFYFLIWFNQILIIFYTCKCIFGGGYTVRSCECIPQKEVEIQVLADQAPCIQTEWSWLRTYWPAKPARKIWTRKLSSVNSLQRKNRLNYFWWKEFGKVKNLTNLWTTMNSIQTRLSPILFQDLQSTEQKEENNQWKTS